MCEKPEHVANTCFVLHDLLIKKNLVKKINGKLTTMYASSGVESDNAKTT